jgi:hypothetical protein
MSLGPPALDLTRGGAGGFRSFAEKNLSWGSLSAVLQLASGPRIRAAPAASLNPAALSVLYTFPRLQPTALAISAGPQALDPRDEVLDPQRQVAQALSGRVVNRVGERG